MCLRCPGLLTQHEPRTNPYRIRAQHQRRRETLSIEQPPGSNHLYRSTREGTLPPLTHLRNGGNQDRSRHITSMSTALAALRTNHIGADVQAFLDVLRVADHVHVEDAGLMEAFDHVRWWDADGGDEELGARGNDDFDQLVEFTLGVVVAEEPTRKPPSLGYAPL